jgi:predicted O-linked N-acetylglucosamine transferase (SPINDLY family)
MNSQFVNGMRPWKTLLAMATSQANSADFISMNATFEQIIAEHPDNPAALLDVGTLLLNFGFISRATDCFKQVLDLNPQIWHAQLNLANAACDAAQHSVALDLYSYLQSKQPNQPMIRRNVLVSQQYNPNLSNADLLAEAKAWGEWAITQANGPHSRPVMQNLMSNASEPGRYLRVGYVSADLCQHTVGLFVKDVLKAHQSRGTAFEATHKVEVFAYSSGTVSDWVSQEIKATCSWRETSGLSDEALARLIRDDQIDVLVDLSGHTAGSRLTVFAHRPAPVQLSWLGYFATTGLRYIDAVLLDECHAPKGFEEQFVEEIVRLKSGRLCYQPVPWAPEVSSLPGLKSSHITFGSFNNTGKLNADVFDVWATVLLAVPNSRLVLKWRTLVDELFCSNIYKAFETRGVSAKRIELRAASFHVDVLKEYADIDIALDPFPFTGGLTSCEALWMGVPVVTWPQNRVVSRQTFALLSVIGHTEWVAQDAQSYVNIAKSLSQDLTSLAKVRARLRQDMSASSLMDVVNFTQGLEQSYWDLYTKIKIQEKQTTMSLKTVLHVGPGHRNSGAKLPQAFHVDEWLEIRLDIDASNEPDILGAMLDLAAVESASVDAIYSAHNIEHVFAHEVQLVLAEFFRVLKPSGFVLITCPDLQTVCGLVADNKLTEAAYNSQAGPITPLDILYGNGAALKAGHHYMAHKTGFTEKSLNQELKSAGFSNLVCKRRMRGLDLWALATKSVTAKEVLEKLASKFLPD